MTPPQIDTANHRDAPRPGPSVLKVALTMLAVMAVLGVIFVGSLGALAYAVYSISSQQLQQQERLEQQGPIPPSPVVGAELEAARGGSAVEVPSEIVPDATPTSASQPSEPVANQEQEAPNRGGLGLRNLTEAILMAKHGDELAFGRVLTWMEAYKFDAPAAENEYDQLADAVDERRKDFSPYVNKQARTALRSRRSRALQASVSDGEVKSAHDRKSSPAGSTSSKARPEKYRESDEAARRLVAAANRVSDAVKSIEVPHGVTGVKEPFMPRQGESHDEMMHRMRAHYGLPQSSSRTAAELMKDLGRSHDSNQPGGSSAHSTIIEQMRQRDRERERRQEEFQKRIDQQREESDRRLREIIERGNRLSVPPVPPR